MSCYDDKDYDLDKFNLNDVAHDSVCVFIGKRRTGKSFCLRELLYKHRDIPVGTCISGSESVNKFFSYIMPKFFIHKKFSPGIVCNAMKRQSDIIKRIQKEKNPDVKKKIDPRQFVILDDCLYDKKWLKDESIREIFMNGRHFKLMLLITMQYPLGIGPELRTNVDYTFIFREPSLNIRKKIYDNYASIIPTFTLFNKIMDKCTENHECLVIKNMSTSNRLEDAVFWYKAEARDNFRIGDEIFWKQQNEDSSDEDESLRSRSDELKKKGLNVRINKKT